MDETIVYLPLPLNQSVQVGDILYYTPTSSSAGADQFGQNFIIDQPGTSIVEVGKIKSIVELDVPFGGSLDGVNDVAAIYCEIDLTTTSPPNPSDFILFAKDRNVNEASILGYYGEFVFKNDSKKHAELFMSGVEVTSSS